jgi:hypothetical protein
VSPEAWSPGWYSAPDALLLGVCVWKGGRCVWGGGYTSDWWGQACLHSFEDGLHSYMLC